MLFTDPRREDTPARLRPRVVHHDGPCGVRVECPAHGRPFGESYLPAERLRNGWVVAHDCGTEFRFRRAA